MRDIFLIPAKKKLAKEGLEDLTKAVPIEYIYIRNYVFSFVIAKRFLYE